jgi:hypothetical protein
MYSIMVSVDQIWRDLLVRSWNTSRIGVCLFIVSIGLFMLYAY